MNLRKRKKFIAFFLALTLLFSCGWEDNNDGDTILGAFLAGCITGLIFGSFHRDHGSHHYRHSGRVTHSRSRRPAPKTHRSAPKPSSNYKHPLTK